MRVHGHADTKTVKADFPEFFGLDPDDAVEIVLVEVTVPRDHGNDVFVAKSRNQDGTTLAPLKKKAIAFVGNTMADKDTVAVNIKPAVAYENEEDVDFEITLTASGPMHDSEIEIIVPEGITALQDAKDGSAKPNHVSKVSASVSGVEVTLDDVEEIIRIKIGKLNEKGTIKVRLYNVNLDGVSTETGDGFRVGTRTRTDPVETTDDDPFADVGFEPIEKIDGGEIRTVNGSGKITLEPSTVEQGSRNEEFKLTFVATTDFSNKPLEITVPPEIETTLVEADVSSTGGKVHADHKGKDSELVVSGNTITWNGLILNDGQKFITTIKGVDLRDATGQATWTVTLGGVELDEKSPVMVVVGTVEDDVVFQVVDDTGVPDSNPQYSASSKRSIRFQFITEETAIQKGGRLWFTVPSTWTPAQ